MVAAYFRRLRLLRRIRLATLAVAFFIPANALPHGALSWAAGYHNTNGTPCCVGPSEHGQGDCAKIAEEIAMAAVVGGSIPVLFPSGERMVKVTDIFASPDPDAPAVACMPGCVFRGWGV
jgi:hypothetical protein